MMKRRMHSLLSLTLVGLLLICLWPVSARAAQERVALFDTAGLLSDGEEQHLIALAEQELADTDLCLMLCFQYGDAVDLGRLTALFGQQPVIVLTVTADPAVPGEYHYFLDTYGRANTSLTDQEVDRILDNSTVYRCLKGGALCAGCEAFIPLAVRAYTGRLAPQVHRVLIPAVIIAAVITAAVIGGVCYSYKKKLRAPIYPLSRFANLHLTVDHDTFMGSSVVRTPISSGNRGGGGGARSGGGSHGGGGRRGGR